MQWTWWPNVFPELVNGSVTRRVPSQFFDAACHTRKAADDHIIRCLVSPQYACSFLAAMYQTASKTGKDARVIRKASWWGEAGITCMYARVYVRMCTYVSMRVCMCVIVETRFCIIFAWLSARRGETFPYHVRERVLRFNSIDQSTVHTDMYACVCLQWLFIIVYENAGSIPVLLSLLVSFVTILDRQCNCKTTQKFWGILQD